MAENLGEFVDQMAERGLAVPEDLQAGAFATHRELTRMAALLRARPRSAESEPAHVYVIKTLLVEP